MQFPGLAIPLERETHPAVDRDVIRPELDLTQPRKCFKCALFLLAASGAKLI